MAAAALQQAGRNAGLLNALLECGVNQSAKAPARQTPSACYYCLMCVSSSDLLLIVERMRAPRAHYTESYLHFMAPLSLLRERYQGNKGRRVVFFLNPHLFEMPFSMKLHKPITRGSYINEKDSSNKVPYVFFAHHTHTRTVLIVAVLHQVLVDGVRYLRLAVIPFHIH